MVIDTVSERSIHGAPAVSSKNSNPHNVNHSQERRAEPIINPDNLSPPPGNICLYKFQFLYSLKYFNLLESNQKMNAI